MSRNKEMVQRYMDAYNRLDHEAILACLTDDVVWELPGAFYLEGKAAFDGEIENDAFEGAPVIMVSRLLEDNDVVVAEGSVVATRKGGLVLNLRFCDVFEMHGGLIRKLISYLAEVK